MMPQWRYHESVALSSTTTDEKSRRYLCWNYIGNIILRAENDSNGNGGRIEIRFADTNSRYKPDVFTDSVGFTMASLSSEGAVFTNSNYNPNKDLLTPSAATNAFLVSSSYIHRTSHSNVTADETDGSIV